MIQLLVTTAGTAAGRNWHDFSLSRSLIFDPSSASHNTVRSSIAEARSGGLELREKEPPSLDERSQPRSRLCLQRTGKGGRRE